MIIIYRWSEDTHLVYPFFGYGIKWWHITDFYIAQNDLFNKFSIEELEIDPPQLDFEYETFQEWFEITYPDEFEYMIYHVAFAMCYFCIGFSKWRWDIMHEVDGQWVVNPECEEKHFKQDHHNIHKFVCKLYVLLSLYLYYIFAKMR